MAGQEIHGTIWRQAAVVLVAFTLDEPGQESTLKNTLSGEQGWSPSALRGEEICGGEIANEIPDHTFEVYL